MFSVDSICDLAELSCEDRTLHLQHAFMKDAEIITPWVESILEDALKESALTHRTIDLRFIRNDCPSSRHNNRRLPADMPQDLEVVQVVLRRLIKAANEAMKPRGHSLSLDTTTWPDYTSLEVVPSWAMTYKNKAKPT